MYNNAAPARHHSDQDERFTELASKVPGFGGLYFDSVGTLVIKLQDVRKLVGARSIVEAFLTRGKKNIAERSRASMQARRMRAEPARYDFRLLDGWHRRFIARLGRKNGIVLSAIGHRSNAIMVGIAASADTNRARQVIAALPIPKGAVQTFVVDAEGQTSDTSIASAFNPIPGGVQITRDISPTSERQCTIGFNVTRWIGPFAATPDTSEYFLTASHCSSAEASLDLSYFGQPGGSSPGGSEVADPSGFTGGQCPSDHVCHWSDASVFKYSVAAWSEGPFVAWPAVNSLTVNGSRRAVTANLMDLVEGDSLDMIGRTSGHHTGRVVWPCANLYKDNVHLFLCQTLADYTNDEGDSGAPVVQVNGSNSVAAVGINFHRFRFCEPHWYAPWRSCPWYSLFSPMKNIQQWMFNTTGYLIDPRGPGIADAPEAPSDVYFYNPLYAANILGTAITGPSMTCHWYSGTQLDYTDVEWLVDNQLIGTNEDVYYSSSSSFTLKVHYWSTVTGDEAWGSKNVSVSEGAPQCYDE